MRKWAKTERGEAWVCKANCEISKGKYLSKQGEQTFCTDSCGLVLSSSFRYQNKYGFGKNSTEKNAYQHRCHS